MKVRSLLLASLAGAITVTTSWAAVAPQATPTPSGGAGVEMWWTGEPKNQPKRAVKGRKFPTESLVLPIDERTGESVATGRLIVKFRDDLQVRAPRTPAPIPASLNGSDLGAVEQILLQSGSTVQQWINRTPDQLRDLTRRAEEYSGRPQPDLSSIVYVDAPEKVIEQVAQSLNQLDATDWVSFERRIVTTQQGCDPQNPVVCNAPNPGCAPPALGDCNPDPGGQADPPNDQYGCADVNCCEAVGEILPGCIDVDDPRGWDTYCAALANVYCYGTVYDANNAALPPAERYDPCLRNGDPGQPPGGPDPIFEAFIPLISGPCFEAHAVGGCNNPDCCDVICLQDPSCCSVSWDAYCAFLALQNASIEDPNVNKCGGQPQPAPTPDFTARPEVVQEETIFGTTITAVRARGLQAYTVIQPVLGEIGVPPAAPSPGTALLASGFRGGGFNLAGLRTLAQDFSNNYQGGVTPRVNGAGINVGVVEFAAFVNHEDFVLATPSNPDGSGGTPLRTPRVKSEPGQTIILLPQADTEPDHGTACLGITVAADNGFGVTGIAHQAQGWFFPIVSVEEGPRLATAIVSALETFNPGDVLNFSIGPAGGPYCGNGTHPTLVSDPGIWTLIRLGSDLGVLSCISAGNSSAEVESEGGDIRSGALIVGACWPGAQLAPINPGGAYCRLDFSNWHSGENPLGVVDLMAWGTGVGTTGYGVAFQGRTAPSTPALEANRLRTYTGGFNGTSAAAPLIAGVAACLQGWAKQIYGDMPLSPEQLGDLLRSNGFQQCSISYGSANFPGNDLCPAAGDNIVGDGAETRHRIGQSATDPANRGVFPEVVSAAASALTSISWPSLVTNYRVYTGTQVTPQSPYRLRADDGIAVEIKTQRASGGLGVAGLVYLTGGWITDIQVTATYDGEAEQLVGLNVQNVAAASRPNVIRIVYVLNQVTRRWQLIGLDIMPQQYAAANFAVDPTEDISQFVNAQNGEVVARIFTAGLGSTPSHFVNHDFVQIGPNPFIPVP